MKKTFLLLACFGILSACSCHKTPVEFQNSFSCKVNGVDWKPEGGSNATGGIKSLSIDVYKAYMAEAITINTLKNIRDSKTGNSIVFEGFNLHCNLAKNDKYILSRNGRDGFYNYKNGCSDYHPDSTSNDFILIKDLDTIQAIVKGTFQFIAISPTCGEKIVVTDGIFEVKYQ